MTQGKHELAALEKYRAAVEKHQKLDGHENDLYRRIEDIELQIAETADDAGNTARLAADLANLSIQLEAAILATARAFEEVGTAEQGIITAQAKDIEEQIPAVLRELSDVTAQEAGLQAQLKQVQAQKADVERRLEALQFGARGLRGNVASLVKSDYFKQRVTA